MLLRHVKMDVNGALARSDRELQRVLGGAITDDTGRILFTAKEIRVALSAELRRGRLFIPLGTCNNIDCAVGCPGHGPQKD